MKKDEDRLSDADNRRNGNGEESAREDERVQAEETEREGGRGEQRERSHEVEHENQYRHEDEERDEADDISWSEADEEEDRDYFERKARTRQRLKKAIAVFMVVALLANVFAFWPLLYNLDAIRFLSVSRELSRNDAISQYKQAIVTVSTEQGKGTGFLISPDGYIVTNHHVIEGNKKAFVRFSKGLSYEAEVVVSEAGLDLAVLKIAPDKERRTTLPVERKRTWQAGEHVYVIGNPLFFSRIANEGTIAGEIPVHGLDVPAMALQAPIYKGNSGSPVINESGEAIAVVFATTEIELAGRKEKVGLAVPVDYLLPYLDKLANPQ
ncbi:S1C family serine protease [Paenibacillus hodogayensis]|uniref:S1C family serine protease n=1 Tax=Paenibacillus hodogayensis TaxID=279208 RepID=A0ABV5W3E4_9BACL